MIFFGTNCLSAKSIIPWKIFRKRGLVVEVEIVCSDQAEHKRRVEQRTADIEGLVLPTWNEVQNREYHNWPQQHIFIDTSGDKPALSIEKTLSAFEQFLQT